LINNDFDENPLTPSFGLRQYAYLIWHWAWLIVLVALLSAGAAYLFSRQQIPVYQASTVMMVNAALSTQGTDYTSILASQNLTSTYVQMVINQPALVEVASRLKLDLDMTKLKESITVKSIVNTQLISVSVEMTDPVWAAQVANTIVQVFGEQILQMQSSRFDASSDTLKAQMADMDKQIQDLTVQAAAASDKAEQISLQDRISQYRDIYSRLLVSYEEIRLTEARTVSSVTQVEPASIPTIPVSPKTTLNTILGLMTGALLAVAAVFLMETLNDTIRDPGVFMKRYNLPILGVIAHHKQLDGEPIVKRSPRSPVSEAFRSLRTNVQYTSVDKPLRTLLVTSPTPSDGKTTIASNLAVALAQGGSKVFVVDADMRRPHIHRLMGAENKIGLSSLFVQPTVHLNGTVQKNQVENVSVISSGVLPPNPAELLASKKMQEILAVFLEQSDIVIIDTPPVLSVTDAVVLAPTVDGVLLVVKPGTTKQAAFRQAILALNQVGANLLGVVVNEVGGRGMYYNHYYSKYYQNHYGYRYEYTDKEDTKGNGLRIFRKSKKIKTESEDHTV
jgi:polysaccharide biosynthesis transport protein